MAQLPVGIRFITSFSRDQWYRAFIFMLTFLLYASFHLSRKPISIVKGELHKQCTAGDEPEPRFGGPSISTRHGPTHWLPDNETDCGWAPFDKNNYQQLLGALDYSFLCAYAIGMYLSGIIGERLPIRYYLTFGMLASGAFTALFGLGYFYNIHSLGFYVVTQKPRTVMAYGTRREGQQVPRVPAFSPSQGGAVHPGAAAGGHAALCLPPGGPTVQ